MSYRLVLSCVSQKRDTGIPVKKGQCVSGNVGY